MAIFPQLVAKPFWVRIPALGVNRYPKKPTERVFFWIAAAVYSTIHLFLLAFFVVAFSHTLWGWVGIREYYTTTLHVFSSAMMPIVVSYIFYEACIIFYHANKQLKQEYAAVDTEGYRHFFVYPAFFIGVVYISLKLFTGVYEFEPFAAQTIAVAYAVLVTAQLALAMFEKRPVGRK